MQAQRLVWQLLNEAKPRWVHFGFPCTFWTQLSRCTAKRTAEEWKKLQTEALEHANLSMNGLRLQHCEDRSGSMEQPKGVGSWQLDAWEELVKMGFQRYCYHSCAFGLKDENSKPLLKPGALGSNRDLQCMERHCSCKKSLGFRGRKWPKHGRVEGTVQHGPFKGKKRSEVAGRYTEAWCQVFSKAILKQRP